MNQIDKMDQTDQNYYILWCDQQIHSEQNQVFLRVLSDIGFKGIRPMVSITDLSEFLNNSDPQK